MANLTDQLNPAQSADSVTPAPQITSGTAVALNGISQMLGSFSDTVRQGAATKRQARLDAQNATEFGWKVEDRAATGAAFDAAANINQAMTTGTTSTIAVTAPNENVFSPADTSGGAPQELTPEALKDINGSAAQLQNTQIAVQQNRLSPLAASAQIDQAYRTIRNAHPNADAGLIVKAFKEAGIDSGLFRDLQQGLADQNSAAGAQREAAATAYKLGRSIIDPNIPNYSSLTDQDFIHAGLTQQAADAVHKAEMDKLSLQAATTAMTTGALHEQQSQADRTVPISVAQSILTQQASVTAAAVRAFNAVTAPQVGTNAEYEARAAATLSSLQTRYAAASDQAYRLTLQNGGSMEAANAAKASVMAEFNNTIAEPFKTRRTEFTAAAQTLTDKFKIDGAVLFPTLAAMRSLNIDYHDIAGITDKMPSNIAAQVLGDFAHLNPGNLSTPIGKLYLTDAIEALTNHSGGLAEIGDPARRQALTGTAFNYMTGNADAVAAGKGKADTWLNSANQVILAVPSVSSHDGIGTLGRVVNSVATTSFINAIESTARDPAQREQAKVTASASRAAMMHLFPQLQDMGRAMAHGDPYHVINYDTATGLYSWQARAGAKAPVITTHGDFGGFASGSATQPIPGLSSDQIAVVHSLNQANKFLSLTTKWDKDSPQGTPLEVRNFYAANKPTAAMKAEKSAPPKPNDPIHLLDVLDNEMTHTPDLIDQSNAAPGTIEHTVNGIIGSESGGNPNARNPAGSAGGLGQFTNETWRGVLAQHRPDLVQGKTPAEIDALKSDPQLSRAMTLAHAKDNAQALANAGLPHGQGEVYMAHFLGLGGAHAALTSPGTTPIDQIVRRTDKNPQKALAGNQAYLFDKAKGRYRTVDELREFLAGKVNSHA